MNNFYKFKGKLNEKMVKAYHEVKKVKKLRNQFMKDKGLFKNGINFYDFTTIPRLTPQQIQLLNIPEKELKTDGMPRKGSKTYKAFVDEYQQMLKDNNVLLDDSAYMTIRFRLHDLMENPFGEVSYQHFVRDDIFYCGSNRTLKEHEDVIKIKGSEYHKALERG